MDDHLALNNNVSRFPVEVCENVIEKLYSSRLRSQVEHSRTLHSCTLVCRAWRICSQRNLFYSVVLRSTEAVRRLARTLDNGPHLSHYIREVVLIGHTLHTTTSPLLLFPLALYGKLPRLKDLAVSHVAEDEDWYPRMSESETAKLLEHLPIHPRFPLFLSAFTTVTRLSILTVKFRHFNDFLGMLNAVPALQHLTCSGVGFITLGPLPMYIKQRTEVDSSRARRLAPNLWDVELVCSLRGMWYPFDVLPPVPNGLALREGTSIDMWTPSQANNN